MKILKLVPLLLLLLCGACSAQLTTNSPGHRTAWPEDTANDPAIRTNRFQWTTNAPAQHFTLSTNEVITIDTNTIVISGTPGGLYDGDFYLGTNYTGYVTYTHGITVTNVTAWYGTNAPSDDKFIYYGPGYLGSGDYVGTGFVLNEGNVFGAKCNSFGTNIPSAWEALEVDGGCNAAYLTETNFLISTNYP